MKCKPLTAPRRPGRSSLRLPVRDQGQELEALGLSRRQETQRLEQRWQEIEGRLLRTDEAYIEQRLEQDSYVRLKAKYAAERDAIAASRDAAVPLGSDFEEQLAYGLGLLGRIDEAYANSPADAKHALVGSIFPRGLTYDGTDYRTSPPSELLYLLSGKNIGVSGKQKTGHPSVVGSDVPLCGLPGTLFEPGGLQKLADHLARIYAIKPLLEAA